ncbi:hypothetical protein ACIBG8_08310 [Nonomuraea sp. NPDC050556]|uniref:hypothetical protein n=1 Tax=Nonomuraea sp. NPDC050556 TaxID=3364369 RepID=UPI0037A2129A
MEQRASSDRRAHDSTAGVTIEPSGSAIAGSTITRTDTAVVTRVVAALTQTKIRSPVAQRLQ